MLLPAVSLPIAAAAPGVTKRHLNRDGSFNSSANPAPRGSYISRYGTGAGTSTPWVADGALVLSTPYPLPQAQVSVTIGGQPSPTQYAGAAPTLPVGVFQINAQVPANIPAGNASAIVTIGGIATSQLVTVAVR